MSQRAVSRAFFLCIFCTLAVLAAPSAEAQITFAPPTVAFGVGEMSPPITATITYATTPPTGQQSLALSGDPGITTFPATVTFMPPASPGSVNVQFQLVASAAATPGTGSEIQISTLGVTPVLFMYDLHPVGVWPKPVPVMQGSSTGPITASMHWSSTPPGGLQELVVGGLPPGATTVPSPVSFMSPTGFETTVSFQIATTGATPLGVHTLTASTSSIPGGVATFDLIVQPPPTISAVVTKPSVTACSGGALASNSVTVTASGISGAGQVTFPGLPSGLTVTPTPPIYTSIGPTPQTVLFDVAAGFGMTPGPYTVTVAVSDINTVVTGTATFTVNVSGPDFFPALSPSGLTLEPGGSSGVVVASAVAAQCPPGSSIWVEPGVNLGGDIQPVALPPGVTVSPVEGVVLEYPGFGGQPLTITASPAVAPGTYRIPFTFSADGGPTKVAELVLAVRSPGTLSAAVEKPSVDVCPGGAGAVNSVLLTPLDGYEGTPSLVFLGVPAGVTITPPSAPLPPLPPAQTVSFGISASSSAAAGSHEVAVRVVEGGRTITVATFVVNVVADGFSASVSPGTVTLDAGGPGVPVTATVAALDCGASPTSVTIAPTGLPAGVTATPPSIVVTGPPYAPAVFTLAATGSTPVGSIAVTFAFTPASGAPRVVSLPVAVVRTGRIGVSVERASMDLCPGGSAGANTLLLTPLDGYTGTPSISFPSLPAGLAVSPAELAAPAMPPAQVVSFQLTAAAGTPPGPVTVTVVASDPRGPSTTSTFVVNVLPPDFTPSVAPSPATVNAGGAGATLNASLVPGSCAPTSGVTVTPSGLPPGVTVTPASAVISPPAFGPAPFAFSASSSAATGASTITFTYAVAGTTRTATALVEVCGPPAAPVSPVVRPQGNPAGPVTATDFLSLGWSAPAAGVPPVRYEWRLNGGAWTSTADVSATAPPRGAVDPVQLFVRGYACSPEKGPGPEASSPVYPLAPPVASFSAPASIVAGRPVTFTDTSSPQATSWLWFPGDGMPSSTSQSPTVTFPAAGPKVIVLVATNGSGSSSKATTVNVLPASAVRAEAGIGLRAFDRQPDGRLALGRVEVAEGSTLLLRRLEGEGEAVAFLRLVDADGRVAAERRLVLAAGEEARHDLSAFAKGAFRVELVGPEGLEAVLEQRTVPAGGPGEPVSPRSPRRLGGL